MPVVSEDHRKSAARLSPESIEKSREYQSISISASDLPSLFHTESEAAWGAGEQVEQLNSLLMQVNSLQVGSSWDQGGNFSLV